MPETVATWLVRSVSAYAVLGVVFAAAFVTMGVQRIDAHAHGSGWPFRLLILPGAALFWPLLAWRWSRHALGGDRP